MRIPTKAELVIAQSSEKPLLDQLPPYFDKEHLNRFSLSKHMAEIFEDIFSSLRTNSWSTLILVQCKYGSQVKELSGVLFREGYKIVPRCNNSDGKFVVLGKFGIFGIYSNPDRFFTSFSYEEFVRIYNGYTTPEKHMRLWT